MFDHKISDLRFPIAAFSRLRIFFLAIGCVAPMLATTVVPPEFSVLVNDSDYIVHAITKTVSAEKRAGSHGVKIVTRVELDVVEVVAGTPPEKVILEMLGGRVGDETMMVEGMPRFRAGDEDILFVSGNGRSICPLYGMMHGRYSVRKEPATGRSYVVRSDGAPLRDTAQIASSMVESGSTNEVRALAATTAALSLAEFIREIRTAVKPGARLNRAK